MANVTFSPDTTSIIPNPERGFYLLAGSLLDASNFDPSLVAIYNLGFRLALANTTLPTSGAISAPQLAQMNTNFGNARTRGMKLIVRFAYGTGPNDPILSVIQAQTVQLTDLLKTNRDVIAVVQAGFIGAYGEWADSGSNNDTKSGKRSVKDYVLAMVPPEIPVNFTQVYPPMEDWYSGQAALSGSEAFTGSQKARTGMHSDCYLTGNGDSFFYTGPSQVKDFVITSQRSAQRAYISAASEYAPFGGETCNNSQGAGVQQRTQCAGTPNDESGNSGGILNEGPRYHLNYLNNSFAPNFISAWQSNGCYNTVLNYMGYRFQLDTLNHSDTVARSNTLTLTLNLHNVGWSRIFIPRRAKITLIKSGSSDIVCYSYNDLRKLPSQASTPTSMGFDCVIPANATTGVYTVHVSFPDRNPTLSANRDYTIRPANSNSGSQVWDNTNGRFTTGSTVTIT